MELYGGKRRKIDGRPVLFAAELLFAAGATWLLLAGPGSLEAFGQVDAVVARTRLTHLVFVGVTMLRFLVTFLVTLKRPIGGEETAGVTLAFGLYYLGFAALSLLGSGASTPVWLAGVALFVLGGALNTVSEFQRKRFKDRPENAGKLYTGGLFSTSVHINFFGDFLWVLGWALITGTAWALPVPLLVFCFFWFYNIPRLDEYLAGRYGEDFRAYAARTKKFVPGVL